MFEDIRFAKRITEGIIRKRSNYSSDTSKNQRCRVLYKVEDIATCLVNYVKFWNDWEVDHYGNANLGDLDNSTNNVLILLDSWTSGLLVYRLPLSVEYDVSTSTGYGVSSSLSNTAYSSLQINTMYPLPLDTTRLSKMDDDLFTYEVEITNIPCDLRADDDSEHEADDMGFDLSDIAFIEWLGSKGDDEVELTDEEFSDNEDEIAEVFRIDTNIFDYETPICSTFNEFNYLLKVDPDLLTKDIMRFKIYDDYKDDWIYEWNKDVPWVDEKPWTNTGVWIEPKPVIHTCKPFNYKIGYYEWYEALEDRKLKDEALRNKSIMEGFIKDNNDESSYEQMRRWDIYTNYDDTYKTNRDDNEREELCEVHEPPVCTIQRFEIIKYSFGQGEEYVAIKEDEYDDLARTSNNACRTYQEIFCMMDEGWMVTRAE
ncbi:hypothetical protein Tco_0835101 [Tanacetum coccineum]